jgi:hypothetical protein
VDKVQKQKHCASHRGWSDRLPTPSSKSCRLVSMGAITVKRPVPGAASAPVVAVTLLRPVAGETAMPSVWVRWEEPGHVDSGGAAEERAPSRGAAYDIQLPEGPVFGDN